MCSGIVLIANELARRIALEEKNEGRINIEDLRQAEQKLTAEEAKEVKGGTGTTVNNGVQLQLGISHPAETSRNTYTGPTTVRGGSG